MRLTNRQLTKRNPKTQNQTQRHIFVSLRLQEPKRQDQEANPRSLLYQ